jgi:hypothetical protein
MFPSLSLSTSQRYRVSCPGDSNNSAIQFRADSIMPDNPHPSVRQLRRCIIGPNKNTTYITLLSVYNFMLGRIISISVKHGRSLRRVLSVPLMRHLPHLELFEYGKFCLFVYKLSDKGKVFLVPN